MLKRLKNAVQNQQEKPGNPASGTSNDESHHFNEGMMCPECHKMFETVDILQKHYEQYHEFRTSVQNDGAQSNIDRAEVGQGNTDIPEKDAIADSNEKRPVEKNISDLSSFVCPQCFQELPSAEDLKSHFAAMHSNEPDSRDVDSLAMRQEINDLRTTLKEEKRYANELKKEVEKLHTIVQSNGSCSIDSLKPNAESESMYYVQQIQMLEAGKALVTTKMLELERQVAELNRAQEAAVREKDRVLEKSLTIAREHASVRSLYDEETSQRSARESRIQELKLRVQDLEAELSQRPSDDDVAVLRKELVHSQTLMNDLAQEKEQETTDWVTKCGNLDKICTEKEQKIADLVLNLQALTKQTDKLKEELRSKATEDSAQRLGLESQLAKFQAEVSTHAVATQEFHDIVSALNSQLEEMRIAKNSLDSELRVAKEQEANFRVELERRNADAVESARHLDEAAETNKRLTNERQEILKSVEMGKTAETALSQLAAENAQLSSNIRDLEKNLAWSKDEAARENRQKTAELNEKSAIIANVQREHSKLAGKVTELEIANSQLVSEVREKEESVLSLRTQLDEVTQDLEKSERSVNCANESCAQLTKTCEDLELSKRDLEQERSRLLASFTETKEKHGLVETQLKSMADECDAFMRTKKTLEEKLQNEEKRAGELAAEKAELLRLRDEAAALYNEEKLNYENKLSECASVQEAEKERTVNEVRQLSRVNESLLVEKKEAVSEIEKLKEELARLKYSEAGLEKQLMEYANEVDKMTGEKDAMAAAKEELAGVLKATEMQAADLRAQLAKVEDILRMTREETTAILKEKQEELDKALEELKQSDSEKQTMEERMSTEIESLKEERNKLLDEIGQLKHNTEEHDGVLAELLANKARLDQSLSRKDDEIEVKEKKINALLTERDMRLDDLNKAQQESNRLKSELDQAHSALAELESKLQQEKAHASQRFAETENEMTEVRNEAELTKQEFASKETDFKEQLRSLTDALSDMRTQAATCTSRLEDETSKNSALEKRLADLERQAGDQIEEKRTLLEKCLMNERDMEEERDNCKELKRRLDDAVSALFELGRQHQSFQIDINRHYSRKWADDSEVHNCTKCAKLFSVTVRKHHCRNCGLIFCAECSNKTSIVAVSKKPVRVCDNCYDDLQSR